MHELKESVNPSESGAKPQAAGNASIAIVGIGCMFPKADGLEAYWSNIKRGIDAITDIPGTHWKPEQYFNSDPAKPDMTYAKRGGFIEPVDFNPLHHGIAPNNIEATDTTQLLGMMVAEQALRDANYETGRGIGDGRPFDRDRTSVILGVTGTLELVIPLGARLGHPLWRKALDEAGVDKETADDVVARIADGYVPWQENSFPGLLGNVAAGRIANRFDLGGSNCVVDAACASSLSAVHMAAMELQTGRMDMVLTGGLDTFNDIFMYMCFSKTPALSPTGNSKPFSADGDGTILGEGLGIVALKRLDDAIRDGDKIYCVIKGIGSSSDGKGNAIYAPSAAGQVKCLTNAYREADVSPNTIELIEAHGTGTKVGDGVEIKALRQVFENSGTKARRLEGTEGGVENDSSDPTPHTPHPTPQPWAAVGSVKSMIGHTKSAAGVAGLIKAAMAVHHKVLPPTIKVSQPLDVVKPGESPVYLNTQRRPWLPRKEHPRRAGVSAFGFGGSNFHCVLEEQSGVNIADDKAFNHSGTVLIAPFSADSIDAIRAALNELSAIAQQSWNALRSRAVSLRAKFDVKKTHRLVLVIERDRTDVAKLIASSLRLIDSSKSASGRDGPARSTSLDGAYYASGAPSKLAFLFPGQGSQYVGMLRDLTCDSPLALDALAHANVATGEDARGRRLSDTIYPIPVFDDVSRAAQEETLRDTRIAQPAIGAVSIGALRLLASFGITPSAAAGHSFGELVALHAAGRIDEVTLHTLAKLRGSLMAEAGSDRADRGSMLAVVADVAQVEAMLREEKLDEVLIANRNAPMQMVLSGSTAQIDLATKACEKRGLRAKKLPVSAAFHSPFVAGAQAPFAAGMASTPFAAGTIPVFANTTASPYPLDADEARAMLAAQLAKPVDFTGMIERMFESGIDTFIEVGPRATLTGLVKSILGERSYIALSIDGSAGKRSGEFDLASLLAQVAVLGHAVNLTQWDHLAPKEDESKAGKKPAMTVKLSGANYVKPRPARPRRVIPKVIANQVAPHSPPSQGGAGGGLDQQPDVMPQRSSSPTLPQPLRMREGSNAAASIASSRASTLASSTASTSASPPRGQALNTPPNSPQPPSASPHLSQALAITQQNILAMQRTQEQMAQLHRQYLEGQDAAQRTMAQLIDQQNQLLAASLGMPVAASQFVAAPPPLAALQPMKPAPAVAPVVRTAEVAPPAQPAPSTKAAAPVAQIQDVPVVSKQQDIGAVRPGSLSSEITSTLLAVVSDKTGYPVEMLELTMSLDGDLGIDSIKRVEILSALQERLPNAPVVKPEDLGTLQTLGQIVEFLGSQTSVPTTTASTPRATATQASSPKPQAAITEVLLAVVADKTGYPVEMLELTMSLDADLGIDSIKRVEILSALQERLPDAPIVKPEDLGTLQTLGQIVEFLGSHTPVSNLITSTPRSSSTQALSPKPQAATTDVLLAVVADKTGYPVEMLELSMSLDADLGIDSIKRVEILSALQERLPDAPIVKPEDLGTLQTLGQIVEFLGGASTATATPTVTEPTPFSAGPQARASQPTQPTTDSAPLIRQLLTATPLTNPSARKRLRLPAHTPVWITDDGDGFAAHLKAAFEEQNIEAVIVPIDAQPRGQKLAGLIVLSPVQADDAFIFKAFKLIQHVGPSLRQAHADTGQHVLLSAVTHLGGSFALDRDETSSQPLTGALAGIIKTASHEWPQVVCKVIDIELPIRHKSELSEDLVDELLRDGPLEVGMTSHGRVMTQLQTIALDEATLTTNAPLTAGDVIVITGGARGVTAQVAIAIAQRYHCKLLLLGRSEAPATEPDWLRDLTDEGAIKKALATRLESATPKTIEQAFRKAMANREVLATIARIEAAGGKAIYQSVDVRDAAQVASAIASARKTHGPIRGIIHGAGVLADRLIEDKTQEQFSLVFGTKVDGFRALLAATADDDLRTIVAFSSSTARFGRRGQVDYAAANEVLNKLCQQQAAKRTGCRVLSINWGPWDGGMVTPALKQLFASEGVGVIGLEAGADYLAKEIGTPADGAVEIVILGAGSRNQGQGPRAKGLGAGASESDSAATSAASSVLDPRPSAIGPSTSAPLALTFEREVSLDAMPILRSHVIGGKAVLPMALMIEWMAHGAIHGNPGMAFHGINDLRVYKGVKVEADGSVPVQLFAGQPVVRDGEHIVPVELRSGVTLHARSSIVLTALLPKGESSLRVSAAPAAANAGALAYEDGTLFHGNDLRAIHTISGCDDRAIIGELIAAPQPASWMKQPIRSAWLADPMAIDGAFQLMIVWAAKVTGSCSLPTGLASYRQFARRFPAQGTRIAVQIKQQSAHEATADIEFIDHKGELIARIEGYTCVIDASLRDAFARNQLEAGASV